MLIIEETLMWIDFIFLLQNLESKASWSTLYNLMSKCKHGKRYCYSFSSSRVFDQLQNFPHPSTQYINPNSKLNATFHVWIRNVLVVAGGGGPTNLKIFDNHDEVNVIEQEPRCRVGPARWLTFRLRFVFRLPGLTYFFFMSEILCFILGWDLGTFVKPSDESSLIQRLHSTVSGWPKK